ELRTLTPLFPRSYSAMSVLVLRSLFHLGILQHSLRAGLVAAGDGAVRSHHRAGFDCALRFHGRFGSRLLDRRSAGPALWRADPISPASLVRLQRAPDCCFGADGSITVGLGKPSAGTNGRPGSHLVRNVLPGFWRMADADPDSLVRLHGRDHTFGNVRHPQRHG